MGPKRRAPPAPQPPGGGKKAKGRKEEEEEEEEDAWSSTLAALKTAPEEKPPATIDGLCPLGAGTGAQVYEDYDCTLNQTNISTNNNKFYIIQLIEHGGAYSTWSRWGRVGEVGQSKLTPFASLEAAKKDFEKKFQEKTKNSWAARESFVAQPGKYTLIEVQPGAGQELEVTVRADGVAGEKVSKRRVLPCTLDKATQDLVALIFSSDMFRDTMKTMNIDVKKMPLGKLSQQQITRGFEALEELEAALREQPPRAARLEELSSRFYTIVPHNLGRARPPPIDSPDLLRAKKDMLLVLADIEVAQSAGAEGGGRGGGGCPPPGPGLRPALLPAFPAGPGLPGAPGDPKLRGADREQGLHPLHLGGGPRGGGQVLQGPRPPGASAPALARHQRGGDRGHPQERAAHHAPLGWARGQGHLLRLREQQVCLLRGLHSPEGGHHVPDGGGSGQAVPHHLRRPHAAPAARRLRQRPGLWPHRAGPRAG
uniref:Poly [ADP-ribose] polymerase 1 n=1 Tax=Anser cygnoides TaxID=8845 RepID=A0A8B9EPK1_ANSCY